MITFKDNIFIIETPNTSYQMKVDNHGILRHLWYGDKTDCDMEYLHLQYGAAFSGNIHEADDEWGCSLNLLPLEYSCEGVGDYRLSAGAVTHSDGSNALDLRYQTHKIFHEKYAIPALPAVYGEGQTLEIVLKDVASEIYVTLKYGVIEGQDIITRSAVFYNGGETDAIITKAASLCLDMPRGKRELLHLTGRWSSERNTERVPLLHGIQEISSNRGHSSHHHNPSFVICDPDCTETSGDCYGALLVYSGSFQIKTEVTEFEETRVVMGLNPDAFRWTLSPKQEFYTPEAILSYSSAGLEKLSHNFHKVIRENVCRGKYKTGKRPVLINNWEATYFNFDEEKLYNIARQASELGVDMLVMDDGWFGARRDDTTGLGDWVVNEDVLKGGLSALTKKITALGMKFGIWFEPEMVNENSDLYRSHPDWVIKIPNRAPNLSRHQLVLDMSRGDVRDYLYNAISKILKSADISYVKWDMNRSLCDWYSQDLPADRQGELPHRHILGVYELLERLTSDFPDVLFEGCSGGGGRFDAGMMYYHPQIWCSDDTDAFERTKIQYGTSLFYPISTVGSHVSAVPNHQTGRSVSLDSRKTVAMAGSFGYEMDLAKLTEEEKQEVAAQIKEYKKHQDLIYSGKYYRLSNPNTDNFSAWEFVSEDKSEALVSGLVFLKIPNQKPPLLKLRGLDENKKYIVNGKEFTAKALMSGGIPMPDFSGDFNPFSFYITAV